MWRVLKYVLYQGRVRHVALVAARRFESGDERVRECAEVYVFAPECGLGLLCRLP
jgi:hypothetical protein